MRPADKSPLHASGWASEFFSNDILKYFLIQTEVSHQTLEPLVFVLKLPQTAQFRYAHPAKFFLPVNGMDYLLPLRLPEKNTFSRRVNMNIVYLGIDLAMPQDVLAKKS